MTKMYGQRARSRMRAGKETGAMRPINLATSFLAASMGLAAPAWAQKAPAAPTRVEFTRPGGLPGAARGGTRPTYMIAPAQPRATAAKKPRKRR